ncbi:hypothetical protein BST95_05370 [Halioglobus japonicus]|nr:lipase secretion chaperone [Halioglobus japonicus]AQA17750.1 hypothetical protein BST95_05370 [Halioglobus japonicus]GHD17041.1 lipase chaperone [Halioglobus japonicus]
MKLPLIVPALIVMAGCVGYLYFGKFDAVTVSGGTALNDRDLPEAVLPIEAIENIVQSSGQPDRLLPEEYFDQVPASLSGIGAPVLLQTDDSGSLIVDWRLRDLFEHYLVAIGEEPLEIIIARIQHYLRGELSVDNYTLAIDILEGYIKYRNNIGAIINDANIKGGMSGDRESIAALKREIRESRLDFLPAGVAEAMFIREDAYDDLMLEKWRINTDATLTPQQRSEALAYLNEQALHAGTIGSRMSSALIEIREISANLSDSGQSPEAIFEARRQVVGVDAASRMAALDAERLDWQRRVDEYRQELSAVEGYPEEERAHLVEEIRRRHFQSYELVRIRAIDRGG